MPQQPTYADLVDEQIRTADAGPDDRLTLLRKRLNNRHEQTARLAAGLADCRTPAGTAHHLGRVLTAFGELITDQVLYTLECEHSSPPDDRDMKLCPGCGEMVLDPQDHAPDCEGGDS